MCQGCTRTLSSTTCRATGLAALAQLADPPLTQALSNTPSSDRMTSTVLTTAPLALATLKTTAMPSRYTSNRLAIFIINFPLIFSYYFQSSKATVTSQRIRNHDYVCKSVSSQKEKENELIKL
jgi:hypothetical protein